MSIISSDHSLSAPATDGQDPVGQNPGQIPLGAQRRSRFCYLFPELANDPMSGLFPGTSEDETVQRLKQFEAVFRPPELPARLRMQLPAVYTYFGQFVNHDMSAPTGGMLVNVASLSPAGIMGSLDLPGLFKEWRAADIEPILDHFVNEHETPLTLSSLYGDGPDSDDPEVQALYADDRLHFRLAQTIGLSAERFGAITKTPPGLIHRNQGAHDIPRDGTRALIADRRNDSNLILCQLHLALMLLHNKAVDALQPGIPDRVALFAAARQLVNLHYQWCILNDYLPHLLADGVLATVLADAPRLRTNAVPMEFTTAAFRFGHSMVGESYDFNPNFGFQGRIKAAATLKELFDFTSHAGMRGQAVQLPDHWVADWNRLTRLSPDGATQSERIDLDFSVTMLNLVGEGASLTHGSIFFRNILRGFHRRIPFGQQLASAYKLPVLSDAQIAAALPPKTMVPDDGNLRELARDMGILTHTPAWVYFLAEAQVLSGGERLGPTASHIIAETFVGLLRHNPMSVLNVMGGWHPGSSPLKTAAAQPLDSIRALILFAVARTANSHDPAEIVP